MGDSDVLPRKQLLELTIGDSYTQLSKRKGAREVSARSVGEPAIVTYRSKTELRKELRFLRDRAYSNANGYILGKLQTSDSNSMREIPVQFYQIERILSSKRMMLVI